MRQHIFCFTVFIIIFGLMSIGTVDAATITEYFDSDPGWHSFNLPINNNDFGFRNSNFAGGNTGEVGGFFSRSDQVAWYGDDTIGNFTGNKILSASGLMNIYNVEPGYNHNFHIGHFDSSIPPYINGIGFVILENQSTSPFSFRIFYTIGDTAGFLFTITGIKESRTWSYLYDPNDGSYGSLTVSISGSGGNTETVFLSESQRNSIGTLNTFGLAGEGQEFSDLEQLEFYIDNVSYTGELKGDINGDGAVDLTDAVIALQVITRMSPQSVNKQADINSDGKIGLEEVICILQVISGTRLGLTLQPPTLISPQSGAVLDNNCGDYSDSIEWDFDWSDVAGATKYQIYVIGEKAVNPVIDCLVTSSSYHSSSPDSYIINYYRLNWTWKVRAGNDNGEWSEWSEVRYFDVEPLNTDC